MSLSALAEAIRTPEHTVLSTDLFDTVLLRDHTTESERLATTCKRAAALLGVDPGALTRLRWSLQDNAYRAVAIERPEGDADLHALCRVTVMALGLGDAEANILHQTEVAVDSEHLRPNRPLLQVLRQAADSGLRVIAVSDTYYNEADLRRILDTVVGPHPIAAVYSSAELGLTKHGGHIFAEVGRREKVRPEQIVHVGDSVAADVDRAQAAAWMTVHLPRDRVGQGKKTLGKLLSAPVKLRRSR